MILDLNFASSPTLYDFLAHRESKVMGLMGPFGSGKSTACCAKMMLHAVEQEPDANGNRYVRLGIIRNTSPELKATSIKTWEMLFPPERCGPIVYTSPITQRLRLRLKDGTWLVGEVLFVGLDKPKDVRRLLSLDLTCAWVNEARELPKAIIDALSLRVGRYPPRGLVASTWAGIVMDTNAPDEDSWWYTEFETTRPAGWKLWRQPPAVLEVWRRREGKAEWWVDNEGRRYETKDMAEGAMRHWAVNPKAENTEHLRDRYYLDGVPGKNLDWIKGYLRAEYGFVADGRAVHPEFDDATMTGDLAPMSDTPLQIGVDLGLTPAAAICQRHPRGTWLVLAEVVSTDMGLDRFCAILRQVVAERFPRLKDAISALWYDPAGDTKDQYFETTAIQALRKHGFTMALPAPTNAFKTRREALANPMSRLIDRKPGLMIDRTCSWIRKGLGGKYHFRRVQVAGADARYEDKPVKDAYSHPVEALQYCVLGGGEYAAMTRPAVRPKPWKPAETSFNPFDA